MRRTIKISAVLIAFVLLGIACAPSKTQGRPVAVERPRWNDAKAQDAISKLAEEYRKDPDGFMGKRTYVWSGTWMWAETIGVGERNLDLLKRMYYEGDDAIKEIALNVIFMNIPSKKLETAESGFLRDLVVFDAELKERKANVPPPSDDEEIIEEYVQPPPK